MHSKCLVNGTYYSIYVLIFTAFIIFISPEWERDLPKVTQQIMGQEGSGTPGSGLVPI